MPFQVPRVNLRKRTVSASRKSAYLATVNSDFLSGLFADVAQVEESSTGCPTSEEECSRDSSPDDDARLDDSPPIKKSRISLTRSMSRCERSYKSLNCAIVSPRGDKRTASIFGELDSDEATKLSHGLDKQDSLHFQLNCVSTSSNNLSKIVDNAAKLAFPKLPATVSNSSCASALTRNISNLQLFTTENTSKESYGWFVEMDEDKTSQRVTANPYESATKSNDLAFSAPTAPNASNYDAEVEWAKAADTVDDVLGDFF